MFRLDTKETDTIGMLSPDRNEAGRKGDLAGAEGAPGVILKLPELPHAFEVQLQWGKQGPGAPATAAGCPRAARRQPPCSPRCFPDTQRNASRGGTRSGRPLGWNRQPGGQQRGSTPSFSLGGLVSVCLHWPVLKMGIVSLPSSMAGSCWGDVSVYQATHTPAPCLSPPHWGLCSRLLPWGPGRGHVACNACLQPCFM